jgi:fimbrial chaperone protein
MKTPVNTLSKNLHRALQGALLLVAAATCQAGSIQLTPVRINLSEGAKVAVLTVHNSGAEDAVMQVTLNKWTLDGQADVYVQSQDLVITPVTFRLAPGAQQIVRIGLRGVPPADREGTYRLLVEEVPPPLSATVTGARLVVRHDLPVFVAPLVAAKPAIDVALDCARGGTNLRLTNIGNVHALLRDVTLEEMPGKQLIGRADTFDYLLPNAQKNIQLAPVAPRTSGKNFLVTALTDQGSFTSDVKNTCQ